MSARPSWFYTKNTAIPGGYPEPPKTIPAKKLGPLGVRNNRRNSRRNNIILANPDVLSANAEEFVPLAARLPPPLPPGPPPLPHGPPPLPPGPPPLPHGPPPSYMQMMPMPPPPMSYRTTQYTTPVKAPLANVSSASHTPPVWYMPPPPPELWISFMRSGGQIYPEQFTDKTEREGFLSFIEQHKKAGNPHNIRYWMKNSYGKPLLHPYYYIPKAFHASTRNERRKAKRKTRRVKK